MKLHNLMELKRVKGNIKLALDMLKRAELESLEQGKIDTLKYVEDDLKCALECLSKYFKRVGDYEKKESSKDRRPGSL